MTDEETKKQQEKEGAQRITSVREIIRQAAKEAAPSQAQPSAQPSKQLSVEIVEGAIWERYGQLVGQYGKSAVLTKEMRPELRKAAQWAADVISSAPRIKPWLHIQGSLGTGKTTLAKAICDILRKASKSPYFVRECTAEDLEDWASSEKLLDLYNERRLHSGVLCIDDIGRDHAVVYVYGSQKEPIAKIFTTRYDNRGYMIYTTNLNGEDLAERYDERVRDRMRECAVVCTLIGETWRREQIFN